MTTSVRRQFTSGWSRTTTGDEKAGRTKSREVYSERGQKESRALAEAAGILSRLTL